MKLTVIDRKIFRDRFPHRKTAIFHFAPYGNVEVVSSGEALHSLRPTHEEATIPLPKFKEMVVYGTRFQEKVWQELLKLGLGETMAYSDVAMKIGHPKAARAVGSAVGSNPIGIIIPCHRILGKYGRIGGFAWGVELKKHWLKLEEVTTKRL